MRRSELSWAGVYLALAAAGLVGCIGGDGGEVSLTVEALSAEDVAGVTVTIEGPGIAPPIVQDLVRNGSQWQGAIGGIPAGTDRVFTVVAYDALGAEIYRGVATGIEVQRNRSVTVAILLQQSTPPMRRRNNPPRIEVVQIVPGVLAPGDTASVIVTATDPDPGDVLTYAWTAPDGTFGDASAPTTTWTAPMVDGTYRLRITVSDASGSRRSVNIDVPVGAANGRGTARVGVSFNTWPEIAQFATDPGLVGAGETTALLVTTSDADGDAVTPSFTDDCGGSTTGLIFTAPASVPPEGLTCTITMRAIDGRGGEAFADAILYVGTEVSANHGPVIDSTFQSRWEAGAGDVVSFDVTAFDVDGDPLTYHWTATSGYFDTVPPDGSSSNRWVSAGTTATIVLRATDPSGAFAEAVFEVGSPCDVAPGSALFSTAGTSLFSTASLGLPTGCALEVRVLVVGGGGGGGGNNGSGGAGGQVRVQTMVVAGDVPLTVGAGGAGGLCAGDICPPGDPGTGSAFGAAPALLADGGSGGDGNEGYGGTGGSGGGAGGSWTNGGGAGGTAGSAGGYVSGSGAGGASGVFDSLSPFTLALVHASPGGPAGVSGGGGGGGVSISGSGGTGGAGGGVGGTFGMTGAAGESNGAGGGGGGVGWGDGGAGAVGVVYVEWD